MNAVRLKSTSSVLLCVLAAASVAMFAWPLFAAPDSAVGHDSRTPLYFALLIPLVLAAILAQISEAGLDVKAVAMLGVLSAAVAAVRPLGAGSAGFESVFFVLILGGRVFGPAFGFVLGCTGLCASAFITGGIGPWLPYQMLACAWVAFGAGCLPQWRDRAEVALLVVYGVVSSFFFGLVMNFSFWPFSVGFGTGVSFVPGAAVGENLHRFVLFSLGTSMGWDAGRALFTALLLALTATPLLATLRRAARKAAFAE